MTTVSNHMIEADTGSLSCLVRYVSRLSDTAAIVKPQTVAWYPVASGYLWEDGDFRWGLKTLLLVEVRTTQREVVALTWLTTVEEYGLGLSLQEAIKDLLVSLSDYLRSLESLEGQLAPSAQEDLRSLQTLMERHQPPLTG